jgi:hypothetical protein
MSWSLFSPKEVKKPNYAIFSRTLSHGWSFVALHPKKEIEFPPGSYYIGEMPDFESSTEPNVEDILEENDYEDGLYSSLKGHFLIGSTFTNGIFVDTNYRIYKVTKGAICILSIGLMNDRMKTYLNKPSFGSMFGRGHIVTFPGTTKCVFTGLKGKEPGQFSFLSKKGSNFHIDTLNPYEIE